MKKIIFIFYILAAAQAVFAQRWAYVVNGNSETLSRINIQTGEVVNHIVNTGPVPNQVSYYDDLLYVVNSGSASLQIIDPDINNTIAEMPLPINSNPLNVAFDGSYAFVSGFLTSSVYKVDLSTRSVIDTFTVGQSPAGLIVANGILYVANTGFNPVNFSYGQGSVSVLSAVDGNTIAQINVGKNPQALIEGPDGLINVICTGNYSTVSGRIFFIDPINLIAIDSLGIGGSPFWPVLDRNGICYLSAGGWSGNGIVYSYNTLTKQIVRGNNNPINVAVGAMGLAIDSAGVLYCTAQQANVVSKFNGQGQVLTNFQVGSGPSSIAIIDQRTGIEDNQANIPNSSRLGQPYPNPFNSQVIIPIRGRPSAKLPETINIYNICGEVIRRFDIENTGFKGSKIIWDGTDEQGGIVTSGIYFAKMAGTEGAVRLVLLR